MNTQQSYTKYELNAQVRSLCRKLKSLGIATNMRERYVDIPYMEELPAAAVPMVDTLTEVHCFRLQSAIYPPFAPQKYS